LAINSKHPQYEAAEDMMNLVSDFVSGERDVKSEGQTYLPALSGMTSKEYDAFKSRANFFPVTSKTCSGLLGAVFYKAPEVALPEKVAYLKDSATVEGQSMSDVAVKVVKGLLEYGRAGVLVDRPAGGGKPYLVVYDGDDICNWDTTSSEPFVVLEEEVFARDPDDKYTLKEVEQYRELAIASDGTYVVNVWQEVKDPKTKKESWQIVESVQPTKNGRPLTEIPFACATPDGLSFEIDKPPLYDLASVNHKHYMHSADLSDAVHVCCYPTPFIAAEIDNSDGNLTFNLGAKSAWVLPQGSNAGFVEVDGKSLTYVENILNRLEDQAVNIGARFVTQSKISTGVETAKGSEIRESQATEMLSSILVVTESLLNWATKTCAEWENADPSEVSIKLNKDLVRSSLDANMVNALFAGYLKGALSAEALYKNLNEGNFYPIDSTQEKEFASIEKRMKEQVKAQAPVADNQDPLAGA